MATDKGTSMACIICRKETLLSEFNVEHIFLDTIGGAWEIKTVCKDCNTKLNDNFNKPFLNDPRIGLCRQALQLGRSGPKRDISNPLKKATVEGEDGNNYWVTFDKGVPKLNRKPEHDVIPGKDGWHVTIHGNPEILKSRMEDVLKEYGYKKSEIQNLSQSITPVTRPVSFMTTNEAIMNEGLKVAYEFTVTILPDYFTDPIAIEYSQFLESGKLTEGVKKKLEEAMESGDVWKDGYEKLKNLPTHLHALYLRSYPGFGLVCIVKFFNLITFFKMSNSCVLDLDTEVLLTNDPILRVATVEKM